jgi:toxin FitB
MTIIILDTNIVSELMKSEPDVRIGLWFEGLGDSSILTTSVSVAEISYGLSRLPLGSRRSMLERSFLALVNSSNALPVLPFDEAAARTAGGLRALCEQRGRTMTFADSAIAGIVLTSGSILATRNVKDFEQLGIEVVNPWH